MRKRFLKLAVATFGVALAAAAQADVTWSLGGSGTVSDSFEFVGTGSPSGVTARVSGWSDPTGAYPEGQGGELQKIAIQRYGGGLGMTTSGNTGDSPDHAVGNQIETSSTGCGGPCYVEGPDEMVLFSFSTGVTLKDVSVGWSQNDSDISVLAYTGSLTTQAAIEAELDSQTWSNLTASTGWDFIGHYLNVGSSGVSGGINAGNVTSSYWLVGALNRQVATSNDSNYPDFVKIASLTGIVPDEPGTDPGVPEPATVLLLAAGLPLLGKSRRWFASRG